MGRGSNLLGDLAHRLVADALDGPVKAPEEVSLYEFVGERYECAADHARQVFNELERDLVLILDRVGGWSPSSYDIHPRHLRRVDDRWKPSEQLGALVAARDHGQQLTRARYKRLAEVAGWPPLEIV